MATHHSRARGGPAAWLGEVGLSGVLIFLSVVSLLAVVAVVFATIRPPTVAEVERDIWIDWARLATDSQGMTITDQILDNRQAACQQLVETLGKIISNEGERFVVRTDVRYIRIRDVDGNVFAQWQSPPTDAPDESWKDLHIDLTDPIEGKVGVLDVGYKFYGGGLESLPNIRRLELLYDAALWLVGVLAVVILLAVMANISRVRERARRLLSQQVTLDLARQMCHELRNGLWAFSLEGKNLRQLFQMIDEYFHVHDEALERASRKVGLDPSQQQRFLRAYQKALADNHVDPATDVLPCSNMAREAFQQIDSFSRYINLTVEELDRNLLGAGGQWDPTALRLTDAWMEACELLQIRFKSAGVARVDRIETTDDWVLADRRALVHVFVNLVKNAIEAMRDVEGRRELTFTVWADDFQSYCSVRNLGSPIPAEIVPHLFKSGFSTKSGAGRGTGLSLVRGSVERMNGVIDVTSSPGEGVTFSLVFPKAHRTASASAETTSSQPSIP